MNIQDVIFSVFKRENLQNIIKTETAINGISTTNNSSFFLFSEYSKEDFSLLLCILVVCDTTLSPTDISAVLIITALNSELQSYCLAQYCTIRYFAATLRGTSDRLQGRLFF